LKLTAGGLHHDPKLTVVISLKPGHYFITCQTLGNLCGSLYEFLFFRWVYAEMKRWPAKPDAFECLTIVINF